ncbi:adenylyl-sulfate kinase [Bacillus sp. FJAT-42376]|uniref:adenylyl-sulfate kinase n=1 Tax=Bacillus sp. FJAT-42376 TaxID=2014076 RepID=UPI000F50CEAE|nr:adenylyl-sulfate kinase [Bacillus sp. FJAT-42376]AZB42874.1 adenylyl-sulfate kinase [Bacillus sp. FJAT-42376]
MTRSSNVTWHEQSITKQERRERNGHHSFVVWLTGLSGSGKSTIANELAYQLYKDGVQVYVLDGDNVRHGLNGDLGFSDDDRRENIRRIGEVAKLFTDAGSVVITAFISPFKEDRSQVRELLDADEFIEVFADCPLDQCEARDPKGLYKKARNGEIKGFTGIDSPYETPDHPEVVLNSGEYNPAECAGQILHYLKERKLIKGKDS